jgi:hypothetical protein
MSPALYGQHFHAASFRVDTSPTQLGVVAIKQPQFWNQRGLDFPAMEDTDHAAFGYDNRESAQPLRDRRGGEVSAPKPQRQIDLLD